MTMTKKQDHGTYCIGDSDLFFLGFAAAIAARWQMLRKGGTVPLPGFAHSDVEAVELVLAGLLAGAVQPLDNVPPIYMAVEGADDDLDALLQTARALGARYSARDEE